MNQMENSNVTLVTEFLLLGLSSRPEIQVHLFLLFLIIYLMILLGNLLIVSLVLVDPCLQTPMYFFLTNLSIIEVCFTTCVFPQMLQHFFAERKSISYSCCIIQVYTFMAFGSTECYILSVMAYDRYVAIRDPLRYSVTMNWEVCVRLVIGSWTGGFVASMVATGTLLKLSFCKNNVINHFLCEMPALLQLSCTDTSQAEFTTQIIAIFTLVCPITFITFSYANIINIVLQIRSAQGRRKAFSTCSSHLLVVILFFVTVMFLYMRPKSLHDPEKDKIVTVFYVAFTPTLNPLIYSLRNKEVKMALRKFVRKTREA